MGRVNGNGHSKSDRVVTLLRDSIYATKDFMSIEGVAKATSEVSGISLEVMIGGSRMREVNTSRQVSMFLARTSLIIDPSYKFIGAYFGGRNHATALHSVNKVRAAIRESGGKYGVDEEYFRMYDSVAIVDEQIEEKGLDIAREIGKGVLDRLVYDGVAVDPDSDINYVSLGEEIVEPIFDYMMRERIFVDKKGKRVVNIGTVRRLGNVPPGFFLFGISPEDLEIVRDVAMESKRKFPRLDYRLNGVLLEAVQILNKN